MEGVKETAKKVRASITSATDDVLAKFSGSESPAASDGAASPSDKPKRKSIVDSGLENLTVLTDKAQASLDEGATTMSGGMDSLKEKVAGVFSKKGKVFGSSLRQCLEMDGTPVPERGEPLVPIFITHAIVYIEKNAIEEPGLFLLPGNKEIVKAYKTAIDQDAMAVDFKNITDPLAVATLLIHYFAEMPEPLLTFGLYERFLDCEDAEADEHALEAVVAELPRENFKLLVVLVAFLNKVLKQSAKNKTNLQALGMAFGGALMRSGTNTPVRMAEDALSVSHVVKRLLESEKDLKAKAKQVFHAGRQSVVVNLAA